MNDIVKEINYRLVFECNELDLDDFNDMMESADYELGVQLLDEEDNVVDSMSTKWTFNNSGTETGTDSTTFSPEENYSWRFYVGSNGATDTKYSPNNPNNEGFITLYAEDE